MKAASLNHVYRLVWSHVQNAWTVVAETAKASGKKSVVVNQTSASANKISFRVNLSSTSRLRCNLVAALTLVGMVSNAYAAPVDPIIIHGSQTVTANGNVMDINQNSDKLNVSWGSFDIAKGEIVNLNQPLNGVALFSIRGHAGTEIYGQLNATGTLLLINPNGVLFGKGSEVNVGNIIASTLAISNDDFLNSRYHFTGSGNAGSVINQGVITAKDEGYIVLLGNTVDNSGTLVASNGSVVLGSAQTATLDFFGNGLVKAKLSGDALQATIKNSGNIYADGGFVQMATNARSSAINISGIVEANQLVERNGVIRLEGGDNAKVEVSGQLIAKGQGTTGGTIEVTGEQVALMNGALLDASGDTGGGKVLVGGDYQGKNDAVYNARTTYVSNGATIKADAIKEGNGGKVVVWANDLTRYYGSISAQGGVANGNGGFVEVSGKQNLAFMGKVNVGAENGVGGTVLLDPENIVLVSTNQPSPANNADGTPDVAFADNAGGTTTIQVDDVKGFSELFLQANNNITVDASAPLTMNNNGSIRFEANNDINVNAALTTTGKGSITLKADADNIGGGNLAIGADITAPGGIVLSGATLTHTAGNISSNGDIYGGIGSGNAGSVSITVAGLADLGTASITANGRTASSNTGGFNGGSVNIQAGSLNMTGNINTSGSAAPIPTTFQGGQGGTVTIATTGNAKVGNITTGAGDAGKDSTISRVSGEVKVNSTSGNVTIGDINTQGGFNSIGANVNLNAASGSVNVGNITTSGGTGRINIDGKSAGKVDITAGNSITTQSIVANGADGNGTNKSGGAAGDVTLNAKAGDINLGSVTVKAGLNTGTGIAGNSAAILAEAGNNLNVTGDVTNDKGSVTLKADADNAGGGNLAIGANITGPGNVLLSGATLTHTAGNISSSGNILGLGHSGSVNITVAGLADLGTANITANGRNASSNTNGFNGGSVVIKAGSLNMTGNINTSGSASGTPGNGTIFGLIGKAGVGGEVEITTSGDAKVGNITTSAGDAGSNSIVSVPSGEVSVTSTSGNITVGDVTTKGGFNSLGNKVTLSAAGGSVTTNNIDTSGGAGRNNTDGKSAGAVSITAGTGITTQTIVANGADGNGTNKSGGAAADVTLKTTTGDVNFGDVTVVSGAKTGTGIAGNGAKILVQAGQDVHMNGNVLSNSNAADAVQLVAEGNFINGTTPAGHNITTGATGRWTIYSNDPTGDKKGSNLLATYNYKQYGTAFGGTLLGTGNGFVHKVSPTVTATLNGTSTKVFDGNNTVTDISGLTVAATGAIDGDVVTVSPLSGATFNDALVGAGKPITGTYNVVSAVTAEGKQIFNPGAGTVDGYNVSINSTATGSITAVPVTPPTPTGFGSPRDNAGLGGLIPNNPILNTMFIVSLNPAAGDEEDLDAVACPTPEDHLGSTPILSSGVKLPDGVNSNCI